MCGIIGYVGHQEVVPVVLEGLRRLEYRGYDSAGIAVVGPEGIDVRRSAGKLANLEAVLRERPLAGAYGIGHTRWATHGRPTEENAHPHRDQSGRVVLVHNGIIENYLELKRELQARGITFRTETDTEVVAHLVGLELAEDGLHAAVTRALQRLRGLFALVVVSSADPGTIVAVRNGPPVVVGLGEGEYFVASDIPAILAHTRDVVFLEDGQVAVLRADGVQFFDAAGQSIRRDAQRITWDPVMAEKAGYKHFMLKEIFEQPWAIKETLVGRLSMEHGDVHLPEINIDSTTLAGLSRVVLLACGTSWHAALVGKFLIEQLARVPVEVDYGSEYRYRQPIVSAADLVVVITQSGETADTLAALREARRHGARSIAICNVIGSMATREAEGTVQTHAGPEIGVASTKAFTTQLVALVLLALRIARARGAMTPDQVRPVLQALTELPRHVEQVLSCAPYIEDIARRFYQCSDFLFLGRGMHYPIALEGALKLKEVSYIHAEGYPAGEMKHGPIALIDEHLPVVTLAPRDHVFEKMLGNVQEVKARGGSVIAITEEGEPHLWSLLDPQRDARLVLPPVHPLMSPITMTVPLQLLAYHVAVRRGCDVDQPRNLAKSVTVE
ncbi:Glutamine--fructose-6-phosphate aminotransferase [isomerizing] [Luteitalea pratensis]|uniref:Glutamine--fructose-6-phosphate aminotransferase [isomerizing] n=1 Tax=Luteitalea pratensis TaxID=1855912 RepID=A0A143PFI0_LUTPR|nr:glutamine--fructose-6-phosphate transaminase (isomerizing) [Luteitalea pratensis]AMY06848.1 Glutamine--fructose-6-phosphate aminotransferase [isomerizing] [Luteitalea pratensis]